MAAFGLAVVLLGAAPAPSSAPSAAASPAGRTLTVVCRRTPMWLFNPGNDRPSRAAEPDATLGQRFGLVGGPRTTLSGFAFYETDVAVVEPGFPPGSHYWLSESCAVPSSP